MSVGWLKVRRTDYETRRLTKLLRNKKLCHMRYLSFWDIWSAYPGMLILSQKIIRLNWGTPHGATILERMMKNEVANHPTSPPQQIMDETVKIGPDGLLNWYINGQWVHSWGSDSPYTTLLGTPCRWACQCCLWYPEMGNEDISVKPIDECVKSCSCN